MKHAAIFYPSGLKQNSINLTLENCREQHVHTCIYNVTEAHPKSTGRLYLILHMCISKRELRKPGFRVDHIQGSATKLLHTCTCILIKVSSVTHTNGRGFKALIMRPEVHLLKFHFMSLAN